MKKTGSKILHGMLLATSAMVASPVIVSTATMANPAGGSVAVGSATITNPSATQTVINQSSKKALINWNSFSIASGSSVTFNQPSAKSLTVNRVTGPGSSTIDGSIFANGNIWLLNANGILFGNGSQVNVGSLLATTSELSDADFTAGNNNFTASPNPNASIVNQGTITAARGGTVVLSAPQVSNQGLIQADLGAVVLGGAQAFTVDMTGDNLLRYEITAPVAQTPTDSQGNPVLALVGNSGTISAAGGHVVMTARAAQNIQDNVINNTGMVEAASVSAHDGEIDFDAGPDGTANVGGTLDVSGAASGQTGGTVTVTGGTVNVADGAKINASGGAGGGTVLIGGGAHGTGTLAHAQRTIIGAATITADATANGNGGNVTVWSDGTTQFGGAISARGGAQGGNGGQVETSGHNLGVGASASVDTSAPLGFSGDWLLDPTTINITSCGSDAVNTTNNNAYITPATIVSALNSGNVTLEATNACGTPSITVSNDISYASSNTLSLLSEGNITVNAGIQNSSNGSIILAAGWDGSTAPSGIAANSTSYGNNHGNILIGGTGRVAAGSVQGATTVAGANVTLNAANGAAQIGYAGSGSGNVSVYASHDVIMTASSCSDCYVQIGDGTVRATLTESGNVSVVAAGNISLTAGAEAYAYSQIGNGGDSSNGTYAGNITVTAGGALSVLGSVDYAQIGNAGWGTHGNATGNITVNATGNISVASGSNGAYGDAQIGHGGDGASGNYTGNISVTSGGLVALTAASNGRYAQIGHGGSQSGAGNSSGNITLNAAALTLTGTSTAAAQGNFVAVGNTAYNGVASGNVAVTVAGASTFDTEAGGGIVWIGNHAQGGGSSSGSVSILTGDFDTDDDNENDAQQFVTDDLSGGAVTIGITDPTAQVGLENISYNSSNAFTILTAGDLYIVGNLENQGSGDITIVNGWNPSVSPVNVTTTVGAYGNNNATLTIGSVYAPGAASLGTAGGTLRILTDNLTVDGDNGIAQLGYAGAGNGAISVSALGNVLVETQGSQIALIGNGGSNATGSIGGDITVNAGGTVTLDAGTALSVAQLGNVGGAGALLSGDVSVTAGGAVALNAVGANATAQIGNIGADGSTVVVNAAALTTEGGAEIFGDSADIVLTGAGNGVASAAVPLLVDVNDLAIQTNNGSAYISSPTQGLSIGAGANGIGLGTGALVLSMDGGITQTQAINASSVNITTSNGSIALSNAGNAIGSAALTASGNAALADSGNLTVAGATVGSNLTLTSNGSIGQSGAISAGNLTVTASNGSIALTNSSNAVADASLSTSGDASLTDSGNLTITVATVGGNLTLTAASIGQTGAITAGDLIATASNGGIALTNSGNAITDASLTAAGDASLTDSGNLTINGAAAGGNLTLTAASIDQDAIIGQTDFISANSLSITATNGNITLNSSGNTFADVSVTSSGDAFLGNARNLTITSAAVIGNLTVTNDGSVGQTGSISAGDLSVAAANVTLNNPDNDFGEVWFNTSGDISLVDAANLTINLVDDVDGNLAVRADAVSQIGPIFTKALIVTASNGSIALTNGDNVIGSAALTASGDAALTDSSNLTVAGATVGGNLTLTSNGSIAQSGAISAGTLTVTASNGSIALTNGGNAINIASLTASGDAVLTDSGNLTVAGATVGGNLTLTSNGSIGQSGAISVGNLTVTASNGSIALSNAGNAINIASLTASGDAALTDSGNLTVAGATVGGNLTLTDNGSIGQSGAINASSVNITTSNGSIVLANGGNAVNIASLTSSGDAAVTDSGNLTVAGATVGGNLTLTGNGSIGQTGAISAGNLIVTTSNGSIALSNAGNTIGSASLTTTGDAALTDSGNLTVAGAAVGGNLTLTGNGSIAQSAAISAGKLTVTALNGSIALTNAGNAIGSASLTASGDAALTDSSNLTVAGATVGGNLTLTDNGSIGQTGAIHAGNLTVTASNGGIALTNGGNAIGSAALTASGDAALTDSSNLTVAGATVGGNLTLTGGSIGQSGAISAGNVTVTASNGGIALTNGGNAIGSAVLTASGDAALYDAADLTLNNATVGGNLTLLTKGNLNFVSSVQSTNGSILAVAGWDGNTTNSSAVTTGSAYGNNSGNITIGGGSGVAVGSQNGSTTLAADDLLLSAVNGYAQVGYHGGGIGGIVVNTTGDVTLGGGSGTAYFAQIGDGGYQVSGSNSGGVSVLANGNVTLNAGSGQQAYAQIGNGGAQSNGNTGGYTNTGAVSVKGHAVGLAAGSGNASYAQIGDGGYKSGQSLNGAATIGADVVVNAVSAVSLNGNAADAYAQIGNGGDFINTGAANGSSGTISGNISVAVANPAVAGKAIVATAGGGNDAYVQIGNGGNGENTPGSGNTVTFNIAGNVSIADLALTGSNTGTNGYAQIGNGDGAKTGTGNVAGSITISQGTVFTITPGTAPGTSAGIQNTTGDGTASGAVSGYTPPNSTPAPTSDPTTAGSVSTIIQNNNTPTTYTFTQVALVPQSVDQIANTMPVVPNEPAPLEKLAGDEEEDVPSDGVAHSVSDSLNGNGKTYVTTKTIIPGVLQEIVTLTPRTPHGVPPADQDYSSWGNEALWRW